MAFMLYATSQFTLSMPEGCMHPFPLLSFSYISYALMVHAFLCMYVHVFQVRDGRRGTSECSCASDARVFTATWECTYHV